MSAELEIIMDHYAASARGDLEGMLACLADEVSWTEMAGFPYAGTYVGPAAVRSGVFERLGGDWDSYQAEPDEFVDGAGGTIVTLGHYSGLFKATGQHMRVRFAHVWHLENEKVVRFEQFTDTHLVREAM
ncbi:MAG: nuclear transport factor 2 family protein [Acidimicrobiales bacterium]